jgi:hypothetical protein
MPDHFTPRDRGELAGRMWASHLADSEADFEAVAAGTVPDHVRQAAEAGLSEDDREHTSEFWTGFVDGAQAIVEADDSASMPLRAKTSRACGSGAVLPPGLPSRLSTAPRALGRPGANPPAES